MIPPQETALFKALLKVALNDYEVAMFYFEGITKFPENTWIKPTNKHGSYYDFFSVAYNEANAVICKRSPIWGNGIFKGYKVEFKYNLNLDY